MKLVTISHFEAQLKLVFFALLSVPEQLVNQCQTHHVRHPSLNAYRNVWCPARCTVRKHLQYFILPGALLRATPHPSQTKMRCGEGWQMCRGKGLNNSQVILWLLAQDNSGFWEPWSPMTTCGDVFKQKKQTVFIRRPELLNKAWIQVSISDQGLNPNTQETLLVLNFALKILIV